MAIELTEQTDVGGKIHTYQDADSWSWDEDTVSVWRTGGGVEGRSLKVAEWDRHQVKSVVRK
jgi:hypothetical protein